MFLLVRLSCRVIVSIVTARSQGVYSGRSADDERVITRGVGP